MAHRIFADTSGTDWLVLAVYPSSEERRGQADRRKGTPVLEPEPRRREKRRKTVRRAMEKGWLVFKGPSSRRRVTPITKDWETCPVRDLQILLDRATQARRSRDPKKTG